MPRAAKVDAAAVLAGLKTKPEKPRGYSRAKFPHWTTKKGCNTRARVLMQESKKPTTTSGRCTVRTGKWKSKYDGVKVRKASQFDVDHFVPIAEFWRSGARKWDTATRTRAANDTGYKGSLIAVSAASNRSKSDRDPQFWLPSRPSFHCKYALTWIAVKYRWRLSVDQGERAALERILAQKCGNTKLRLPARAKVVKGGASAPGSGSSGGGSVYYKNCDAARAAGAAPVYQGQPGYGIHLDRDRNGVGCQ